MRFIDKNFGIPLCLVCSIANRILKLFKCKTKSYKNILIIELPEMGSALLSYTAIKYLKTQSPTANIYFLTFTKNRESIEILNIIPDDNIITISSDNLLKFLKDTILTIFYFRKKKIDLIIDLEMFSRFSMIYSFLINPTDIAGFYMYNVEGLYRGKILTIKTNFNYYQHISENYLALIQTIFNDNNEIPQLKKSITQTIELPEIPINNNIVSKLKKQISECYHNYNGNTILIVISPSGEEIPLRGWDYNNYAELIKLLLKNIDNAIVILTGTKTATAQNQNLKNKINNERCIDFTGKTTLLELIQLMHIAKILVTNDGGAAHFSALTNIKSFVFFGPETPVLYRPLSDNATILFKNYNCSPCINIFNYRVSACKNNRCVNDYSSNELFDMIIKSTATK